MISWKLDDELEGEEALEEAIRRAPVRYERESQYFIRRRANGGVLGDWARCQRAVPSLPWGAV